MKNRYNNAEHLFKIALTALVGGLSYYLFAGVSSLNTYLFMSYDWTEAVIRKVEIAYACAMILFLIFAFLNYRISIGLILFLILISVLDFINGGKPHIEFTFMASMVRSFLPLGLFLLVVSKKSEAKNSRKIHPEFGLILFLKISLSLIFASHGIASLKLHPVFIDYIIGTGHYFTGIFMDQTLAEQILSGIGWMDVAIAILILFYSGRWLLVWMVIWTALTTILRVVETGIFNFPELLIRIPHVALPLIYLLIKNKK